MQPAMRYIAPFTVLLFAGVFSSVRLPDSKESRQWLEGVTFAALAVVCASLVAHPVRTAQTQASTAITSSGTSQQVSPVSAFGRATT